MKYILMMNCPRNGYDSFASWPKKDIQAHIVFMMNLNKELSGSGELVSADYRRCVPGIEGVSCRVLDRRRRIAGARLRDRRQGIGCAGTRRCALQHAHRGAASDERAA